MKRVTQLHLLALTGAAMLLSQGCTSLSTMHTAHPIATGKTEIGIAAQAIGVNADGTGGVLPTVELQVRHGLSEDMDFGIKVFLPGIQADLNYMLLNPGAMALSLDPAISVVYFGAGDASAFLASFWLPVLFDVVHTDSLTLTVGAKVAYQYASTTVSTSESSTASMGASGVMFGGVVGLKLMLGESFGIMPEINVYSLAGDALLYNASLAFLF